MVLAYYGVRATEQELGRRAQTTVRRGTTGERLVRAARALGFQAYLKDRVSLAELRRLVVKQRVPVIVNWFSEDDGHYSVVVHLDRKNIYLNDPELKRVRKLDLLTFRRVWFDFDGDFFRSPKDLILRRIIVVKPH
jgi:predicted double-glycine peptidase